MAGTKYTSQGDKLEDADTYFNDYFYILILLVSSRNAEESSSSAASPLRPSRRTLFTDDVFPDMMLIRFFGIPKNSARIPITSRLASPLLAGDLTVQPTARLHALYPEGNDARFDPGETSSVRIAPFSEEVIAGEISVMKIPECEMSPGFNNGGSSVACRLPSPVFTLSRAVPVAQPGCPVVHLQIFAR
jgi:hypothetical protein